MESSKDILRKSLYLVPGMIAIEVNYLALEQDNHQLLIQDRNQVQYKEFINILSIVDEVKVNVYN